MMQPYLVTSLAALCAVLVFSDATAQTRARQQLQLTDGNQDNTITLPATLGDKISLYGNRLGQANMYGFGIAANTLTYKSANTHQWYVNGTERMSLAGDILSVDKLSAPSTLGDKISLFGNRFGQANMYGFGIAANTLYYKSANTHKWYIDNSPSMTLVNGRLGIGTQSPDHELIVQGNDPAMQIRDDTTDNSANAARLELLERAGGNYNGGAYFWWNGETNKLLIGTKNEGNNRNILILDRGTENVGIGTQNPGSYKLAVNGKIRAKEIVVETGWSDFVFEDDYVLRPLSEVKSFIEDNGHLPDVPSAKTIESEGVSLGENQAVLLRKIEELTLYTIALEERLAELEAAR
ncbi:hypothetical protein PUV54_00500 [Hyphococcus flavus]|uniref:Peptidase S74 domain-containing protein n=1 Tax=Hyphococcus flavus TaxID=1866326 RepID=A0AAE9ZC60_9PROT|nr:hypothetical protein [Hyphococcus flavus]WDI31666.1 hypothetical protein PUV54_00500 [Hyphococcus flavus]